MAVAWDELQTDPEYLALALQPSRPTGSAPKPVCWSRTTSPWRTPTRSPPSASSSPSRPGSGSCGCRGIIDRLDLNADGELVVIDYKTGRAPSVAFEQSKLIGVHIYALLCKEVLGRRPVQVKLLHLKEPTTIIAEPSEQAIRGIGRRRWPCGRPSNGRARRGLPAPDLAVVQLLPLP